MKKVCSSTQLTYSAIEYDFIGKVQQSIHGPQIESLILIASLNN